MTPNLPQEKSNSELNQGLGKILAEWKAPEFTKYEKNSNWLGMWLIVSITVVALAIIFKNFMLAIFLILAALMVFFQGLKDPRMITFKITARGLHINDKVIPFSDIKSFWILYEPPEIKELLLKTSRISMAQLTIHLGSENPVHIRQALIGFVPEKEQKQSLIDMIMRLLKF